MGFTYVTVKISNPARIEIEQELELLVDTGAMLSIIPRPMLEGLGIRTVGRRKFRAFGGVIERETGVAVIRYYGNAAGIGVVFGEEGNKPVMSVTALEALGYQVDPVTGELKPTEMLLL